MDRPVKAVALFERIKKSIADEIESGKLKPDDRVPSETLLTRQFGASRMTANRALRELAEEGRIIRIKGLGSFVAKPRPDAALLEIRSIAREIEEWGGVHASETLVLREERAGRKVAEQMQIQPGDPVFHSIVLHRDREVRLKHSERFVNPAVAPDYLKQDFSRITASEYLLKAAPVHQAEVVIEAITASRKIRERLCIGPQVPCLCMTRRTWSSGRVATFSIFTSPGPLYRLKGRFTRD